MLLDNISKIHTTYLGSIRIKNNVNLSIDDLINIIKDKDSIITKKRKNWYVEKDDIIITINSYSYTIITAKKNKLKNI